MKYKRQVMTSMVALALIAGGSSVFATDIPTTTSKLVQQNNQTKMKANTADSTVDVKDANGKDLEIKDDTIKKVYTKNTKKQKKVHTHSHPKKTKIIQTTATKPLP